MTKIFNNYQFLKRHGIDLHNNLFIKRIKLKNLRGGKHLKYAFIRSRFRKSVGNLLLLNELRGNKFRRRSKRTQYGVILSIQRRFRLFYGIKKESQFRHHMVTTLKSKNFNVGALSKSLKLLELRLDVILWRICFSKTTISIRQIIKSGKIQVNGIVVKQPSLKLKIGDIVNFDKFLTKNVFFIKRRFQIQKNYFNIMNFWITPVNNFVEVDYKNFIALIYSNPKPIEIYYPFGDKENKLVWFHSLKYKA